MSDTEDNNAPEEVTAEQRRQREAMGALDRADEGATLDDSAAKNAMSALGAPKKTNEAEAARKKALAEVQARVPFRPRLALTLLLPPPLLPPLHPRPCRLWKKCF